MSNLMAREALERAKRLFLEKPGAAKKSNTTALRTDTVAK